MLPQEFEQLPLGKGVSVLGYKEGLLALNKPESVRSHPNSDNRVDNQALLLASFSLREECYILENGTKLYLLHRLDGPTSGVLVLTSDVQIAGTVRKLFEDHNLEKVYYAWVKGKPKNVRPLWKDRLRVSKKGGKLRTIVGSGDVSLCKVKALRSSDKKGIALTLLQLKPQTGRTHQLRVQCASRYIPIVGDATYGDFNLNKAFVKAFGEKRLFLHAGRISLSFGKKQITFEAEMPKAFQL
jgi:23S rRNA-/tRNA-specific pseudouridylate synthase